MSKAVKLALYACAFVFTLALTVSASNALEAEYGCVTANDVNMRSEPSTENNESIITVLPLYTRVEILSYDNNWFQIVYNEQMGYVRSENLFVSSTEMRSAYVLIDGTGFRGIPGEAGYVIKNLAVGQPVKIKSMVGEWYFTVIGDEVGYVHASGLTLARPGSSTLEQLLKSGMSGQEVLNLQKELKERGFLTSSEVTGYYGKRTSEAIAKFQEACGLDKDGVAGDATLKEIYDPNNKVTLETAMYNKVKGEVILMDWFKEARYWFPKNSYFTVTDVNTGLSFNVRRTGGSNHSDTEPVTAEDTAIFKSICGRWTWNRRAIWVTYRGKTVAASMNCMPHLPNPTKSNNFPGHFCIHFLHSKGHASGRECPIHQSCVMKAYRAGK